MMPRFWLLSLETDVTRRLKKWYNGSLPFQLTTLGILEKQRWATKAEVKTKARKKNRKRRSKALRKSERLKKRKRIDRIR